MTDFKEQEIYLLNKELDQLNAEKEQYKKQIRFDEAGIKLLEGSVESLQQQIQQYRQCIDEIERLTKMNIQECIDFDDCYRAREQMKIVLQLIKQVKKGENNGKM